MRGLVCLLGVMTVLAGSTLAAQAPVGGTVSGVVRDEQGGEIPGVAVTARSDDAPGTRRTLTDRNGRYVVADLPPGAYTITAELSGFATFKRPAVAVRAGLTVAVDLVMRVGVVGETIEVRQELSLIHI